MKKQLPVILLGIACLALLFAYTNANKTIEQLRSEVTQLKGASGDNDVASDSVESAAQFPPAGPVPGRDFITKWCTAR